VSCVKHVMDEHIVLEFAITNTIADQLLVDTSRPAAWTASFIARFICIGVKLEPVEPIETYSIVSSVGAPSLHCGLHLCPCHVHV